MHLLGHEKTKHTHRTSRPKDKNKPRAVGPTGQTEASTAAPRATAAAAAAAVRGYKSEGFSAGFATKAACHDRGDRVSYENRVSYV